VGEIHETLLATQKTASFKTRFSRSEQSEKSAIKGLALTCFETPVGLVDHVSAAFTPDYPAVPMPLLERFQGIDNFHFSSRSWGVSAEARYQFQNLARR
jgi:hypothetical protein